MKEGSKTVRGQKKDLGTATYPVFDSVQEADDFYADKPGCLLGLINTQVCTKACNEFRQAHTEKTGYSKKALILAITRMGDDQRNELIEAINSGDEAKAAQLISEVTA